MGAPEEHQIKEIKEEKKFYEEMTPEERAITYKEKTGVIIIQNKKKINFPQRLNRKLLPLVWLIWATLAT